MHEFHSSQNAKLRLLTNYIASSNTCDLIVKLLHFILNFNDINFAND